MAREGFSMAYYDLEEELITFVNELREEVVQWLKKQHPDFLPVI